MIYLLHGNDLISSRKKLESIKLKYTRDSIEQIAEKNVDYSTFPLFFSTTSLFGEKRLVVVEGKLDHSKIELEKLAKADEADLVIWIDSVLRSNDGLLTQITKLGGKVELFEEKLDSRIFPFLDAVVNRKRVVALTELNRLFNDGQEAIYIHTMLVWQFRQLLVPEKATGFVKKKVLEAVKNFSFEELRRIYYQLLQLDVQLKTGEGIPQVLLEQFVLKVTR